MSWSISTSAHKAEHIRSAIEHAEPQAHLSDEQLAQLRAGKEAAIELLNAGALGPVNIIDAPDDRYFRATLSGHAGEDKHAPGEKVTVEVAIASPPE